MVVVVRRTLKAELEARCGEGDLDLPGAVVAISRIPYGRPRRLSASGVLDGWRGTCSTKHLLFAGVAAEAWPDLDPRLWHRPYTVTPRLARERWGSQVAASVPAEGLVDVHTFATVTVGDRGLRVDVTFPLDGWDGASDIPLACGEGPDHPAGADPLASKARLVARHCDPPVREPFIAALAAAHDRERATRELDDRPALYPSTPKPGGAPWVT